MRIGGGWDCVCVYVVVCVRVCVCGINRRTLIFALCITDLLEIILK